MATRQKLTDTQYRHLLELRTGLRRFVRWSEQQADAAGLTAAQHQLLLAVRGHERTDPPTIGELATHLLLRHHSAVGLVDRAEQAGLVIRRRDPADHRVVRVSLTKKGDAILESLTAEHLEELSRLGFMIPFATGLDPRTDPD